MTSRRYPYGRVQGGQRVIKREYTKPQPLWTDDDWLDLVQAALFDGSPGPLMLAYYEFRDGDGRWPDDLKTAQDWFPRHPTWRWFNSESYQ